jgi:hypothetical protein
MILSATSVAGKGPNHLQNPALYKTVMVTHNKSLATNHPARAPATMDGREILATHQ